MGGRGGAIIEWLAEDVDLIRGVCCEEGSFFVRVYSVQRPEHLFVNAIGSGWDCRPLVLLMLPASVGVSEWFTSTFRRSQTLTM